MFIESKKLIQFFLPAVQENLFTAFSLIFCIIEPHRNDTIQLVNFVFVDVERTR